MQTLPSEVRAQIPPEVVEVCVRLHDAGYRAWVVGGCVRDLLLGRGVHDWDICTEALPKQTRKLFKKVVPTGIKHGTVTVLWKGEAYEVTTLRGEGEYTDGRRPDEVFFVSDIELDLARRDFTVNAIAYDPIQDNLVDPHGGLADMKRGVIRAVGVAAERFAEDGLRILRGARFVSTLELDLEAETEAAFAGALETYAKVSHERIREEWLKTMKADRPSLAFEVMRRTGILQQTCPLLVPLADHAVGERNAWEVTLDALDRSANPPEERLACLLHGVGRPRAANFPRTSADLVESWLNDFRFSRDEKRTITHLIRHQRTNASWNDHQVRGFVQRAEKTRVHAVLRVGSWIDAAEGRDDAERLRPRVEEVLESKLPLTVGELPIDGQDVKNALGKGGRAIGEILRASLDRVVEDPSFNNRERLLALVDELAAPHR